MMFKSSTLTFLLLKGILWNFEGLASNELFLTDPTFFNVTFQNIFDYANIIVSIRYTAVAGIIVNSDISVDEKYIIYKYVE